MVGPIIIECFSEVLSQAKRNCSLLEAGKNSPQINNPIWVARPYQMSGRVLTVGTFMLCVWVSEFLGFAQGFIFFVYCIAFASPLLKSNVAAFNQIWDDDLTLPWRRHVVSLPSSIWERREEKRKEEVVIATSMAATSHPPTAAIGRTSAHTTHLIFSRLFWALPLPWKELSSKPLTNIYTQFSTLSLNHLALLVDVHPSGILDIIKNPSLAAEQRGRRTFFFFFFPFIKVSLDGI